MCGMRATESRWFECSRVVLVPRNPTFQWSCEAGSRLTSKEELVMSMRSLMRLAIGAVASSLAMAVVPWTSVSAQAQAATVSGKVVNDRGAPIQYASVAITALGLGTQTDVAGNYTFVIPAARLTGRAAQLEVRAIGYKRQFASITLSAGAIRQDFSMPANPLQLGEIIVTGSGTSTVREKLGTVVSTVRGEDVKKSAEPNIVNALAAKAPGVEVTSQAGDPGAGSGIVIRGFATIQGDGQPLFVIDGMPIDNSVTVTAGSDAGFAYSNRASDINPADVESVEILKGAAAAALYGIRGANGVVLITTKSGKAGATRYSWQSTSTFDEVNRSIPIQNTFGRGTNGTTPACATTPVADGVCQLRSWGAALPAGTQTYDHFGDLFRTGSQFDNVLQISGGDANRTFLLSAGNLNQTGVAKGPNSAYGRNTVRLRATQAVGSKMRIGGNFAYTDVNVRAIQKGNNLNGLFLGSLRQPPEWNPFPYVTASGLQRAWSIPNPVTPGIAPIFDSPLWTLNQVRNTSDVGRTTGNISVDYNPFAWATLNYTLGADYGQEKRLEGLPPGSAGEATTGTLFESGILNTQVDHNLVATLRKSFSDNLKGSLVLGQNLNISRTRIQQTKGQGYIAPDLFTLNNVVSTNITPQNFESQTNIAGYFAQTDLEFFDQLFVTAGIRADQTSALSKKNRTAYFPKASLAWNVTNFLGNREQKGRLSYLKLRGSYGEVGRQPFSYQNITVFTGGQSAYAYGTGAVNAASGGVGGLNSSTTFGDENLKFERTAETEGGIDFGILNQRIDGSVTYYNRDSRDVILGVPVAPSFGYTGTNQNGARITNKGVEVQLNARILERQNLRWELGVNYTRNRNLVKELQGAEFIFLPGGFGVSAAVPGKPIGTFFGSDFVRCRFDVADASNIQSNRAGADIDINAACRNAGAANGAMYVDADGFPLLDQTNYAIGDPNRNFLLGVRTGVTLFKKLQVSALVDIANGGVNWNGTRGALQSYGTSGFTSDRGAQKTFGSEILPGPVVGPGAGRAVAVGEGWFRSAAATKDRGPGLGNNFNGPTSQFVEASGFTRLREVSLAYSLDNRFVKNTLRLSSLDVRLAGRNLWLSTDYSGIDPETNLSGPIGPGRGQDYFNNPQTRSWVISVNLNR
jgi:TonB-linked SusC/RagA family outer membrane protein